MERKILNPILQFILVLIVISLACTKTQSASTDTPRPTTTVTPTFTATNTPRPSPTPRPTQTPNRAATQHIEELDTEIQTYYEKGYLTTNTGTLMELDDFSYEWAQLGSYKPLPLPISASDFFISAHFKWNSALETSGTSGCGFIFGLQPNNDHYAVFLDRTKIYFRIGNPLRRDATGVEPIRAMGKVKFDYPAEADFTLIVKGPSAYVLVNGEVVGEYILPESEAPRGQLGLTVLSGTNKDYGTRCEMTNLHLWIPDE